VEPSLDLLIDEYRKQLYDTISTWITHAADSNFELNTINGVPFVFTIIQQYLDLVKGNSVLTCATLKVSRQILSFYQKLCRENRSHYCTYYDAHRCYKYLEDVKDLPELDQFHRRCLSLISCTHQNGSINQN
jgi:hypothetical protein